MRTIVVVLCAAGVVIAAPIVTGTFVIEAPGTPEAGPARSAVTDYELLENPGFETGALAPWVGSAWHITDKYPHGGAWCAFDIGNASVVQWTDTVSCAEIQSVTFWSRQPDQPAAQAYTFFYSDGTHDQFVHFPGTDWTLMDVTGRLNRSKELVGFEIWGYSGGGPGPDSTYVDDVSIAMAGGTHSVEITLAISPVDTVYVGAPVVPAVMVRNLGTTADSFEVAMMVEDTAADEPLYWDTIPMLLRPGEVSTAGFDTWVPTVVGRHRANCNIILEGNSGNDTLRWFFHVAQGTGVENAGSAAVSRPRGTSVVRSELRLPASASAREPGRVLLDVAGRAVMMLKPGANDVSGLAPGVYFVRAGNGRAAPVVVVR